MVHGKSEDRGEAQRELRSKRKARLAQEAADQAAEKRATAMAVVHDKRMAIFKRVAREDQESVPEAVRSAPTMHRSALIKIHGYTEEEADVVRGYASAQRSLAKAGAAKADR